MVWAMGINCFVALEGEAWRNEYMELRTGGRYSCPPQTLEAFFACRT